MAILDTIKTALRVTSSAFDTEIQDIIDAAKIDLTEGGAANTDETDRLVLRALTLYAKANFGMSNPDMEQYQRQYDRLKTTMALAANYQTGGA